MIDKNNHIKEKCLYCKMGIYSNGNIFGIQLCNFNYDDLANTLFEQKYDEIMSYQQMREAYLFYNLLHDKNGISIRIYMECSTTYDKHNKGKFMMWHPISVEQFMKIFSN